VLAHVFGMETRMVWHAGEDLKGFDLVVLPGGFSYGDYLRTGAIARFAPIMSAVRRFVEAGGDVLRVCNGFQLRREAGFLPGAMLGSGAPRLVSRPAARRVERTDPAFTRAYAPGEVLSIPIAHNEGNFYASPEVLARLERNGQIVFRYSTPAGK